MASVLVLQRSAGNRAVAAAVEAGRSPVHDVVRSGRGVPLAPSVQADMAARLGSDFSDVRVHTDARAAESATALGARAYTVGRDIVFATGEFDPTSGAGRRTLAHELQHVVQQRAGAVEGAAAPGGIQLSDPSDRHEREASAAAERVMSGPPPVQRAGVQALGERPEQASADRTAGAVVQRDVAAPPGPEQDSAPSGSPPPAVRAAPSAPPASARPVEPPRPSAPPRTAPLPSAPRTSTAIVAVAPPSAALPAPPAAPLLAPDGLPAGPAPAPALTETDDGPALGAALPPVPELPTAAVADPALAALVAQQSARVRTAATQAEQSIDAALAMERARLGAHFAQLRAQADGGRAAATTRLASGVAAARADVSGAARAAGGQVVAHASTAGEAAGSQVTALADEAQVEAARQATRATTTAGSLVPGVATAPSSGDPDVASGQQRIGDAVARRAASELPQAGAETAAAVRSREAERQSQLYGPARAQATQQVQEGARQADAAIRAGATTADGAVRNTAAHTAAAVTAAHARTRSALAAGHRRALADLQQWAATARARVRAAAAQLATALVEQGTALARVRRGTAGPAVSPLRLAGDEAVAAVSETRASLCEGASVLASGHRQAVAGVGQRLVAGFTRAGELAAEAVRRPAQAYAHTSQQAAAAAGDELRRAPARVTEALSTEHSRGLAEASGLVDRSTQQQAAWAAEAGSRARSDAASYADQASRLRGEAEQVPVQRLFGELVAGMRSWLRDRCGDVLGGIISGIVLSLPAIAIAVALVLSGPVGWAVLAGLLVVGAGLGIYGRFSEYAADHGGQGPGFLAGVVLVALGIADVTGIPYIVEAAAGRRAYAPVKMSRFERWERGTQGVIALALAAAGGAKKLFGRGPGEGGVPVERPPVPGPREGAPVPPEGGPVPSQRGPAPAERAPAESASARPPMTRARMIEVIKEVDSGRPVEFTPEVAEALRMNAELATAKWTPNTTTGQPKWASIRAQMSLTRWRFLSRAPEVAEVLRTALHRLPEGPERADLLRMLDAWVAGGDGARGTPVPVPVPAPRHEDDGTAE